MKCNKNYILGIIGILSLSVLLYCIFFKNLSRIENLDTMLVQFPNQFYDVSKVSVWNSPVVPPPQVLTCPVAAPPPATPAPRLPPPPPPCPYLNRNNMGDNYQESCSNISMDNNGLVSASCRDVNGNNVDTSINVCNIPVRIQNCNGHLVAAAGDCNNPSPSNNCPGRTPNDGNTCADCPPMTRVWGMNCIHI